MQDIKWIFRYIKRKILAIGIFLIVINSCVELIQIQIQKEILNGLRSGSSMKEFASLILALVVAYATTAILFFVIGRIFHKITYWWREDVINELHDKIQKMDMQYFEKERIGKMTALFADIEKLGDDLFYIPYKLGDMIKIIIISIIIGKWNFKIFMFLVLINVILCVCLKFLVSGIQKVENDVIEKRYSMLIHFEEGVSGEREIIANNYQVFFFKKMDELFFHLKKKLVKEVNFDNQVKMISTLVKWSGLFLVIVCLSKDVIYGRISVGSFFALYQYVSLFFESFQQLYNDIFELMKVYAKIHKIHDSMNRMKEIDFGAGKKLLSKVESIQFQNAYFAYEKDHYILKHFSTEIKKAAKNVIVGASGKGKSTLVDILLKNYTLSGGECVVNHTYDLQDISIESWMQNISVVYQDTYFFYDTVRNNILLGRTDISDERIMELCDMLMIGDTIRDLSNGLDEMVMERGINFSGGQRQRLALVRALIRDGDILIMDEATSALDENMQYKIQFCIDELYKDRILIVISHQDTKIRKKYNYIKL